jgi:ATP/maltotriose-dependent transcriptional regulator MalT
MFAEAAELFGVANDAASQDAVVRNIAYLLTPKSGHEFERWQAESERLAAIGGDLRSRFSLLRTKGFRAFYLGDLEPARAWLEQSLAMARDFGDVFVEVDAAFLLARIALAEGDLGLAEELGGSLRRLGQGLGLHRTEEEGLVLHALVAARRGRSEEAADLLGRARAALEKVRAEYEMVEVAHAEAVVALEAGRWDDAIEWSEALGATTLRFDADLEQTRALLIAGRARLGAGRLAEAAEALREASARAGEREQTSLRRAADAALAEALALSGRIDEARAALDAAGDEPDRYPEALAMRLEADAIVAAHEDDRDRAQARLAAAVRSWELLGTTIWSARAAQLRSQLAP